MSSVDRINPEAGKLVADLNGCSGPKKHFIVYGDQVWVSDEEQGITRPARPEELICSIDRPDDTVVVLKEGEDISQYYAEWFSGKDGIQTGPLGANKMALSDLPVGDGETPLVEGGMNVFGGPARHFPEIFLFSTREVRYDSSEPSFFHRGAVIFSSGSNSSPQTSVVDVIENISYVPVTVSYLPSVEASPRFFLGSPEKSDRPLYDGSLVPSAQVFVAYHPVESTSSEMVFHPLEFSSSSGAVQEMGRVGVAVVSGDAAFTSSRRIDDPTLEISGSGTSDPFFKFVEHVADPYDLALLQEVNKQLAGLGGLLALARMDRSDAVKVVADVLRSQPEREGRIGGATGSGDRHGGEGREGQERQDDKDQNA